LSGTGAKGRLTAKILLEKNIPFSWVSVEPEKFGAGIYGIKIRGVEDIQDVKDAVILNAASIDKFDVLKIYEDRNSIFKVFTL
jgi:hypothetical protein